MVRLHMAETPQFGTAEYSDQSDIDRCRTCNQPIVALFYRVSGAITCPACAEQTSSQLRPDSNTAFARALMFGIGGALLGLILYSIVGIATGLEIGYVSLAVGYIVGRAVVMGSSGLGGKRYQIAAAVLTYAAVSMSAVPIMLYQIGKQSSHQSQKPADPAAKTEVNLPTATVVDSSAPKDAKMSPLAALAYLALLGLASPVLNLSAPLQGLLGIVILFVGLRIAWRMTAGTNVPIMGPFKV
jgi:hypothetical protein